MGGPMMGTGMQGPPQQEMPPPQYVQSPPGGFEQSTAELIKFD